MVVGEQFAQVLLVAIRGDLEDGDLLGERAPQRALAALQPPAGLIDVERPGAAHPAEQLLVGLLERVTGAVEDRVDRADRDPGAEQLLAELDEVAARDTIADRQCRERRLQARPERAAGNLAGQLAGALDAAAGAAHTLAAMLGDPHRDLRQLLDLMTRRLPNRNPLRLREHVAAATGRRPVIDELVDRPRRQQLTTMPLMTRLPALAGDPSGPCRADAAARPVDPGSAAATSYASYAPADARAARPAPQAARSDDPSPRAPRQPPHDPRHRSPRPQPAPHRNIRRPRVMSPNQLNAYRFSN